MEIQEFPKGRGKPVGGEAAKSTRSTTREHHRGEGRSILNTAGEHHRGALWGNAANVGGMRNTAGRWGSWGGQPGSMGSTM